MRLLISRWSVASMVWVGVALLGPASATLSGQAPAQGDQQPSRLLPTDRAFARAAANDAQAEVAIASLAQQTTSSDIVKMFAEEMQHEYLAMTDELREFGDHKHEPLPNVVSNDDQITLDTLSHLSGHEFDVAFADNVVAAHREAIAAFQLYASTGGDPELRAFADRRLPKLRKLLAAAEDVRNSSRGD